MPAPTSLPAPPQGQAASALSALKSPSREATAREPEATEPVDFASLMKARSAESNEFAALQAVKAELDTEVTIDASEVPADLGALLAEISQPLAPTAIPLVPVAAPAIQAFSLQNVSVPDGLERANTDIRQAIPADILAAGADGGLATDLGAELAGQETGAEARFKLPESGHPALAQAQTQGTGAAQNGTAGQAAQLAAQQPIHSPKWSNEVGQGLVWMARNEVQTAQMAINPPNLGPLEITLTLNRDRATAHFASPFADVREAIQEALPRLREILEGAGVQLGQADVGEQSRQELARQNGRTRGEVPEFSLEHATLRPDAAVNEVSTGRARLGRGLVDTFV